MAANENGAEAEAGPSSMPCKHLLAKEDSLKRYSAGLRWGRRVRRGEVRRDEEGNDADMSSDAKRRKLLPYPSCCTCHAALHRPFVCLECAAPACFMSHVEFPNDCMRQHLHQTGHAIAFDIFDGTIYCSDCDDVVYDDRFERIASKERATTNSFRRANRINRLANLDSMKQISLPQDVSRVCKTTRGMYNLGATCFMNVILQSFLHNPLMRNYFLSDRHNAALCPARENCLACELDTLYMEFYSTTTRSTPFAPTNFLFCVYLARESTELSSAGEHDAHELFIASLNSIHSALMAVGREPSSRSERLPLFPHGDQAYGLAASRSGSASNASEDGYGATTTTSAYRFSSDIVCPCVVHRTFSGIMQSDVTCQRCGWTSTTHDPFLDLSLDIRSKHVQRMSSLDFSFGDGFGGVKKKSKKQKERDEREKKDLAAAAAAAAAEEEQTLVECMRRYCAMEKLAQSDYSCAQCGVPSQAVKQLSICRLPPVLCFQLKRFEHNAIATAGQKIEHRVRFPLTFDMSEYCTSFLRQQDDDDDDNEGGFAKTDAEAYLYDLFSVVVHEGKMNTGHYYCYFKWRDTWYIANDDNVHPAKLDDVLSCRAYQLCYKRRRLHNVRT